MPESPLVRFKLDEAGSASDASEVVLGERPFLGHLNLRGRPEDDGFLAGAERALGLALPLAPNTTAGNDNLGVLWLGPDEWLILTPPDGQVALQEQLEKALAGCFASAVDVSSGNTVISVSGTRARELLSKGTSLDVHARAFPLGRCAQTHFAHSSALICHWDPRPSYELVVRRSFADYLWQWLLAAARDMNVGIEAPASA